MHVELGATLRVPVGTIFAQDHKTSVCLERFFDMRNMKERVNARMPIPDLYSSRSKASWLVSDEVGRYVIEETLFAGQSSMNGKMRRSSTARNRLSKRSSF